MVNSNDFELLLDEVFDELVKEYSYNDILKYKKELLYVFYNEEKNKSQIIYNMIKPKNHIINQETYEVKDSDDINELYELNELNFYETLDKPFNELYEKYGWNNNIMKKKNILLKFYNNKNNYEIL